MDFEKLDHINFKSFVLHKQGLRGEDCGGLDRISYLHQLIHHHNHIHTPHYQKSVLDS
jgi:hypothetical protein